MSCFRVLAAARRAVYGNRVSGTVPSVLTELPSTEECGITNEESCRIFREMKANGEVG